nr:putative reverse transcriptase domain, ribonuclease H-like domain, aspartic peptidase domain protein [Tanacetum cinerariifolium]
AAPVARALYCLASSKMKELANQLQELSEKGFIRPSSSPWGAPQGQHSGQCPSRKERERSLRVRSLVMMVHVNLPEHIHNAQTKAMKKKNVKAENLGRLIKSIFEIRSDWI